MPSNQATTSPPPLPPCDKGPYRITRLQINWEVFRPDSTEVTSFQCTVHITICTAPYNLHRKLCFLSSARYLAYLSLRRSPIGRGLTEIRGKVEMEPCDWLLAKEEVSRLSGDCGGVMRLGLLHSECEREPGIE